MKNLIGKKVRGFKFDSRDHCVWFVTLEEYIGRVGVIDEYLDMVNVCIVKYGEDCLLYPAELIEQHIVDDEYTLTPREKAIELVDKFADYTLSYMEDKQCALIAVDDIILILTKLNPEYEEKTYWHPIDYYKQVKTEIEKL